MQGNLLYTRSDGTEFRLGELVKLHCDTEICEWNNLKVHSTKWNEHNIEKKYGMLIGAVSHPHIAGIHNVLAKVLVDGTNAIFEWEDLELNNEKR